MVINVWGMGFKSDHSLGTTSDMKKVIDTLHGLGYFVILGVPYTWRTSGHDCNPAFHYSNFLEADAV